MKILGKLYVQVLIAIGLAIVFGLVAPKYAVQMKPLGEGFIALLKMMLGPIIFCTVVHGVGHVRDFRKLGRLGLKTLLYFEVVSTLAMLVGFTVVNVLRPGDGLHASALQAASHATDGILKASSADFSLTHFLLSIIPRTLLSAFTSGDILPVLFVSLLVGAALSLTGKPDWIAYKLLDEAQAIVFKILGFIMRLSPLGAFGAMAAAVGSYGGNTLLYLLRYILTYYASTLIFIFVILGAVAALAGLSIFRILSVIKDEAILAMGTAASEAAFPRLVGKLGQAGCDEAVVGFVLPAGYSFNIDGACLYMACGVGFIAQATDTPLPLSQQLALLAVMLVTSKGGAGAAGGALVKLTATLQSTGVLPLSGVGLLFGIDRVLAIATSTTNVIGNSVAVFVLSKWEGMFDRSRFDAFGRTAVPDDTASSVPSTPQQAQGRKRPATEPAA
ncbi:MULTISPECIES: cation:dicarboxylate symporter family transporter [unclassified Achromobacter]|uniref:cation:dicarboxylate symporter family transporter n=1 Tax=unclassified Achromobacter TaxID=2626865 RepID=UPI000B51B50C|nr:MULTISPECIES: cation:dicarboxylase symporter family transporter [unclassified Achromobacter]OWT67966.1 C4-dicarboxylate transporter DctA [Achromobacter sp. HZ28]OWT81025.1 C4-dicarboxylate transporter DctA [Achromobacter sp. HZ34]